MATKKPKAVPTDDELKSLLEGLGEEEPPAPTSKPAASTKKLTRTPTAEDMEAELAELENLGRPQPDRPRTPRIATPVAGKSAQAKRTAAGTPPLSSTRSSEEKPSAPRRSGESTRSFHTSFTPSATSSELTEAERKTPLAEPPAPAQPAPATTGGWWGGILATASAAVKTAEAAVKEIQQNEEAKRWAEQVKGNVGALRGLGAFVSVSWQFPSNDPQVVS